MHYLSRYHSWERKIIHFLKEKSIMIMRYLVATIYVWYGLLKVFGVSPVSDLVIASTSWIFPPGFVTVLGWWEVAIGSFLCFRPLRRLAIFLFIPQVLGTFLPLVVSPEDCFVKFPFILTLEGHYIFKNIILIGAILVIGSTLDQKGEHPIRRDH